MAKILACRTVTRVYSRARVFGQCSRKIFSGGSKNGPIESERAWAGEFRTSEDSSPFISFDCFEQIGDGIFPADSSW